MPGLTIPPAGALDFVALGALVNRLDPGTIPFRKAHECQIHVSGGEFNVAAFSAVTAVRPPAGDELLAAEADAAVTATTAMHEDGGAIREHC